MQMHAELPNDVRGQSCSMTVRSYRRRRDHHHLRAASKVNDAVKTRRCRYSRRGPLLSKCHVLDAPRTSTTALGVGIHGFVV